MYHFSDSHFTDIFYFPTNFSLGPVGYELEREGENDWFLLFFFFLTWTEQGCY